MAANTETSLARRNNPNCCLSSVMHSDCVLAPDALTLRLYAGCDPFQSPWRSPPQLWQDHSVMTSNNPIRPADRVTRLKVQQTLKMGRSAHAYVCGSTIQFYEWLEAQRSGTLPEGPPT